MMTKQEQAITPEELAELRTKSARYEYLWSHYEVALVIRFFGNGCVNKTRAMVEELIDKEMENSNGK